MPSDPHTSREPDASLVPRENETPDHAADRSTDRSGTYRLLLHRPHAAPFFATAGAGRIGIAMTSLGLAFLVQGRSGTWTSAGIVVAVFAVAEAVIGPQVARSIDHWGQSRVLPALVGVHAVAITLLLLALQPSTALAPGPGSGSTAVGAAALAAALAGASIPQLGALSAARWAASLRGDGRPDLLPGAFSLESLVNAVAFLVAPVLTTALSKGIDPAVGTITAAALIVTSGLALALQRASAPVTASDERVRRLRTGGKVPRTSGEGDQGGSGRPRGSGPTSPGPAPGLAPGLLSAAFLALVTINAAIGVHFGVLPLAVAALAEENEVPTATGLLLGVSSAAGLAASWGYGRRRWRTPVTRQLMILGAVLALAGLALATTGAKNSLIVAAVFIALTGATVPPVLVLSTVLVETAAPVRVLTQAMTWLNSASAAGSAAAVALIGHALDRHGAAAGFAATTVAGTLLAITAVLGRRSLAPRSPHGSP